jgi:CRP-like cAMP-binding protein
MQDVPRPKLETLAAGGVLHHFRKGTYLCHQGDSAPDVFFLLDGRVEINTTAMNGSRVLHATIDTPQFIGELAALGDMPRTASVLAVAETDILSVNTDAFVHFVAQEPTASRAVARALARQVQAHQAFVDDLLFLDLKGRVAKRLLQLVTPSLEVLPKDGTIVPTITHADLASLCGGSRENVTRILTEFQRRNLIEKHDGRFRLKKVSALAKVAEL